MIERALYATAFSQEWGRQMRFITGPRQAGKTTLAKLKLRREDSPALYYLWDLRGVRDRYKADEFFFAADARGAGRKPWVCFDEIHKMPKWKNILKGLFDESHERFNFIVTGSAKFDIARRAGDSLAGRYFTFHLFPLRLAELRGAAAHPGPSSALDFTAARMEQRPLPDGLDALLRYSGFPEPFLGQSPALHRKWAQAYTDRVIREDLAPLTRITEHEYLLDLYRLLPEMVASPVSAPSLASHLEVSPQTIKGYLRRLADFHLIFKLSPYSKNIKRSLLKASKVYPYDWTRMADEARRFEGYIACELNALLQGWADASGEAMTLSYVRTRDKKETDFLIVREGRPWLLIEAKLSDGPVAGHHRDTARALGAIPVVQICRQEGVASMDGPAVFRVSASRFF